MKILFDEITVSSKIKNLDIFDGEKDIIISKKDFNKVKTIEGAIPISENCRDLNTLKIKSVNDTYKVNFTEDQQDRIIRGIIEVPSMPFAELQAYNFEPSKKYRVHINQDCMNNTGGPKSPLPTFLKSKENIVEAVIDNDVTSINNNALYNCYSLTNVNILSGVTSIGKAAFAACGNLISISIPISVTSIGDGGTLSMGAFNGCRKLSEIIYTGTKEQCNAIKGLGNAWFPDGLFSPCIIHCTNGDITIN